MHRSLAASAGSSLAVVLVVGAAAAPVWLGQGTGGGPDRVRLVDRDPTLNAPPQMPYLRAGTVLFPDGTRIRVGPHARVAVGPRGTEVQDADREVRWYTRNGVRVQAGPDTGRMAPLLPERSAAGVWHVRAPDQSRIPLVLPSGASVLGAVWEHASSTILVDGVDGGSHRWWRCPVDSRPCGVALERVGRAVLPDNG